MERSPPWPFISSVLLLLIFIGFFLIQFLLLFQSVPALLYAIVVISTVGYSVVSWINKHIPASVIAAFWPVQVCMYMYGTHVFRVLGTIVVSRK